jgi:hypothetical protein
VYHNLPILDYSKIKTNTYYKTHKFREENIPDLMKLPSSVDAIFPLVKTVKIFFSSLYDKLNKIMIKVDSELKTNSELVNGLTEKIKSAYYKQKTDVQAKMIIANAQNWKPIPHKFFVEEFCNLPDEDEIHHTIKNIIMTIKPWESNYTKTIEVMIEKSDPNLRKLFGYMLVAI